MIEETQKKRNFNRIALYYGFNRIRDKNFKS